MGDLYHGCRIVVFKPVAVHPAPTRRMKVLRRIYLHQTKQLVIFLYIRYG